MPPPHSSTSSHIATETALLTTLYNRSKAQHRSQLFLSRLRGVLRLAKRVLIALNSPSTSSIRPGLPSIPAVPQLLAKFTTCILHAAAASNAILELHHFVPLHTTLVAAYARLLAITLALGSSLDLPPDALVAPTRAASRRTEPTQGDADDVVSRDLGDVGDVVSRDQEGLGIGIKIDRSSLSASARGSHPTPLPSTSTPTRAKSLSTASKVSVEVDSEEPKPEKTGDRPSSTSQVPAKKKRPSDMDDIFGHSSDVGGKKRKSDAVDGARKKARAKPVASATGGGDATLADSGKTEEKGGHSQAESEKTKPKSKTKSKTKSKDGLDDIFDTKPKKKKKPTEGMDDKVKTTKKKSKKGGGEMDDIFGF